MDTLHLREEKFSVVPNTIDFRKYDFSFDRDTKRAELDIPRNNTAIICVSNLKPRKGYEELLEAFEKLHGHSEQSEESRSYDGNITLLIVGGGEEKEKYLDQIKDYASKKNIRFLGKRTDVKEILRTSDIFVLATYSEGMSNALLEAMASRLAIVTTDIDVNKEVIDNDISGLLVPTRDASALADALSVLIADESKRKRFGERAHQEALKKYEIDAVINRIRSLYEEVLTRR
jgi:glycosyltransferase involved in cell wall biosynthesis